MDDGNSLSSDEDNYHPDIGFVMDDPGQSEYAYKGDVDNDNESEEDNGVEEVDLSYCTSPRLHENQQQQLRQNQQQQLFNNEDLLSSLENLHFEEKVSLEGKNIVGNRTIHNIICSGPNGIFPNIALLFCSPLECLFVCGGLDQTGVGHLAQGSNL